VASTGRQIGFIFPVGNMQGYFNLKGYWEFAAENRPDGWNAWVTFSLSPPAAPPVAVVNQIRTYWWCSPPRTGRQRMVPASSTARETGASFSKDKCVLISL